MGLANVQVGAFDPIPTPETIGGSGFGTYYAPDAFNRVSVAPILPPQNPARVGGISEEEHREIDAQRDELERRASQVELLGEYTSTIHPDRLLAIADNIASGKKAGPPQATPAVLPRPPPTSQPPVDLRQDHSIEEDRTIFWTDLGPASGPAQSYTNPGGPGGQSVDLTSILEGLGTAVGIYQTVDQIRNPQPAFINPSNPTPDEDYEGSLTDWLDGPFDPYKPSNQVTSLPSTGGTVAYQGAISNRDRAIAAASGASPEMVDRVLHFARQGRRRRRRMLTKSDIGDISTMRQILGGGEAFKVWLAKATR